MLVRKDEESNRVTPFVDMAVYTRNRCTPEASHLPFECFFLCVCTVSTFATQLLYINMYIRIVIYKCITYVCCVCLCVPVCAMCMCA
jgi:hypothetical protein